MEWRAESQVKKLCPDSMLNFHAILLLKPNIISMAGSE